jgi:hypothetical protein
MLVKTIRTSTGAPVIDFDISATPPASLASLIEALSAAVRAVDHWAPIEDELSSANKAPRSKVYGGKTPAQKIVQAGKPDIDLPSTDWFYRSREEIEKDHLRNLADAKTDDDRAAIESRTAELLAEFDRQEKAAARAVPKELRTAKRKLNEAHRAWSRAEQAIVAFKPASVAEAVALLDFAGKDALRGVYFHVDESDLKAVMRNAADAIRAAQ